MLRRTVHAAAAAGAGAAGPAAAAGAAAARVCGAAAPAAARVELARDADHAAPHRWRSPRRRPRPSWQGTPTTPPPAPPPASSWQGAPTTPPPAPTYSGPVYEDVNVEVAGSNVPSIDVFYNDLAPHGSWYDDPTYGWVFAPPSPSYVPYSNGRWVYTDYGYTWVSADPFGWATDHYGRWVWANRWVWRPDTTWGPAWVQWRQGDGYVGWAPAGYTDDAYVPETSWRFVGAASLFAPDVPRYYVTANIGNYLRGAVPVRRYVATATRPGSPAPTTTGCSATGSRSGASAPTSPRSAAYNDQQRREAERRAREHQRDWDARRRHDDRSGGIWPGASSVRTRRAGSRRRSNAV